MKNIDTKKILMAICLSVFGNLLYAMGVILFIEPNNLITGGMTGIALALHYVLDFPTSILAFIFNAIFFIIGWIFLGKKFALSTLASTILYPIWMLVLENIGFGGQITDDRIIATVFGGILMGAGIGAVIRGGGSTGGIDVLVLILKKYVNISVGLGITILDVLTLAVQLFFPNVTFTMFAYGIVIIAIYSIVIDKVVLFGNNKLEIKILTDKQDEMRDMILYQLDRGLTYLHAKTGYLQREIEYILTVVDMFELSKAKKMIYSIDPNAFVIITPVSEVRGRGFSTAKIYQNNK